MDSTTILLGNKAYSSWSLRGWLPLAQTGAGFEEVVVPLDQPDTRSRILEVSPSGRVPALQVTRDGRQWVICDSLAIAEFLAEQFPDAGLWPEEGEARSVARSVAAEMHAGFAALRAALPMDLRSRHPWVEPSQAVAADIERICEIWRACRERYGQGGAFLFGRFTAADAAYAPVVTRFVTYGVPLDSLCAAYRDAVAAWPAMMSWTRAAEAEPWVIDFPGVPATGPTD